MKEIQAQNKDTDSQSCGNLQILNLEIPKITPKEIFSTL
jgi:hypothetical protein